MIFRNHSDPHLSDGPCRASQSRRRCSCACLDHCGSFLSHNTLQRQTQQVFLMKALLYHFAGILELTVCSEVIIGSEGFECFELGVICITFSLNFLSDALFHCITVAIYFTSQQKTQQQDMKYKQMIHEQTAL